MSRVRDLLHFFENDAKRFDRVGYGLKPHSTCCFDAEQGGIGGRAGPEYRPGESSVRAVELQGTRASGCRCQPSVLPGIPKVCEFAKAVGITCVGVFGPRKVFLPLVPADRFKTDLFSGEGRWAWSIRLHSITLNVSRSPFLAA